MRFKPRLTQSRSEDNQSLRLFIALWPDDATRDRLTKWQLSLSGRKTPAENLHMTLFFLGDQPKHKVKTLSQIIKSVSFNAIPMQLDQIGYFSRSQISWAGIKNIPDNLVKLHQSLITAISEDESQSGKLNRFKYHITLARHSNPPQITAPEPIIWHANQLVLAESRLGQGKNGTAPLYIPLIKHILKNG